MLYNSPHVSIRFSSKFIDFVQPLSQSSVRTFPSAIQVPLMLLCWPSPRHPHWSVFIEIPCLETISEINTIWCLLYLAAFSWCIFEVRPCYSVYMYLVPSYSVPLYGYCSFVYPFTSWWTLDYSQFFFFVTNDKNVYVLVCVWTYVFIALR